MKAEPQDRFPTIGEHKTFGGLYDIGTEGLRGGTIREKVCYRG